MINSNFSISLEDGIARLQSASSLMNCTQVKWTEEIVQYVLALNPQLLDIGDHLPIKLDGGSTEVSPDQLYIDDIGRLVIVEIKNECAKLSAHAQLIAYSEHYSIMPLGELHRGYSKIAMRGTCADVMQSSLDKLRSWASVILPESIYSNGSSHVKWKEWPTANQQHLKKLKGLFQGNLSSGVSGSPARLVLIAPDFAKECIELAEYLRKRYVPMELIQANLYKSSDNDITMSFRAVLNLNQQIEPTWKAVRSIYKVDTIREHFAMNAWADHLNYSSFSFSAYDAPQARFWITADTHSGTLSTVIPDGWCPGPSNKSKLRQQLLDKLPKGFALKDRVWIRHEFELPLREKEFIECAKELAKVIREVLVPNAP
jgi:hypothetical protein